MLEGGECLEEKDQGHGAVTLNKNATGTDRALKLNKVMKEAREWATWLSGGRLFLACGKARRAVQRPEGKSWSLGSRRGGRNWAGENGKTRGQGVGSSGYPSGWTLKGCKDFGFTLKGEPLQGFEQRNDVAWLVFSRATQAALETRLGGEAGALVTKSGYDYPCSYQKGWLERWWW